jgi:8-amino-7-oxononanoate synthase
MKHIQDELGSWKEQGLYRDLKTMAASGGRVRWNNRECLNFSSNDYLDLAHDPRVKQAAVEAVNRWGCGATASPLMCGHLEIHAELESRLASMTGQDHSLVFGSGFLTNLGILSCLASRNDILFTDRLNHASLIDGARLSPAGMIRYRHLDINHLEELLDRNPCSGRRWIVTDSVFSMDGDYADLKKLRELADRFDGWLVVDEAHAFGIMGNQAGGLSRLPEINILPDITIATLGKSLGGYGGFAACREDIRNLIINRARSYIYSTALPPACAASSLRAAEIIREEKDLGSRLLDQSRYFRNRLCDHGLKPCAGESQIVPYLTGDNHKTLNLSRTLEDRGILAVAVRPPTVPEGTARLRFSITLAHQKHDLDEAAEIIAEIIRANGLQCGIEEPKRDAKG